MAGLLGDSWDDPRTMASLLGAAGLLSGGNFGQAMGRGLLGYQQVMGNAQEMEMKKREMAQREQFQAAQMEEMRAQAQQRQMQAQELQRKAQQELAKRQALPSIMGAPVSGDAFMPGAPPTGQFNLNAALSAGYGPDEITKLQGLTNLGKQKVARTMEVDDGQGGKKIIQLDEYGQPVGEGMAGYVPPTFHGLGGMTGIFQGPKQIGSLAHTQTPDSVASNALTRRGQDITVRGQDLTDARLRDQNATAATGNLSKVETDLRKEFGDLPEVKKYKNAYPAYAAIEDAATRNTPQADINLIYGLAKTYDPESVVREGEYATIANSQAIPEWLKGQAQRLAGGGKLSPETKRQILQEAKGRIMTLQNEYDKARNVYEQIAVQRGANPANIFTPIGKPVSRANLRYNPKTGQLEEVK